MSALSIKPSQNFKGNDGLWSTFNVNTGQPVQQMQVLPATSQSFTMVIIKDGCPSTDPFDQQTCSNLRGGIFNPDSTFQVQTPENGGSSPYFSIPFDSEQTLPNYSAAAEAGLDALALDWYGAHAPSTIPNQVIAGIATSNFWLGIIGLRGIPNHIFTAGTSQASPLQTLRNDGNISSLYFGYTAGAHYKEPPAFGSLTFGGYDAARVNLASTITVPMQGTTQDLSVYINHISIGGTAQTTVISGMDKLALIDSLVPEIWLPQAACQQFESALGLTWNSTLGMYLVNDTQYAHLRSLKPTFAFTLSNTTNGGPTTTIQLPYEAFDLNVSFPLAGIQDSTTSLRYFPLKQSNDTQGLFLGRTFLQEAYIAANYDNNSFTVGPALFPSQQTLTQVVAVGGAETTHHSLSGGAIAGIVIGALAGVALIAGLIFWWWRRRRQHYQKEWEKERQEREKSSRLRASSFGDTTLAGETSEIDPRDRVTEWYKGTSGPQSPPAPAEDDPYLKPELDATPATGFSYFQTRSRHELDAHEQQRPSPHRSQQSWGSAGSGISPMPSDGRITSMQIGSDHSGEPASGASSPPMLGIGHGRQMSSDSQLGPVYEMGEAEPTPREVNADPTAENSQHIASSRGLGVTGTEDATEAPVVTEPEAGQAAATEHAPTGETHASAPHAPRPETDATVSRPPDGYF